MHYTCLYCQFWSISWILNSNLFNNISISVNLNVPSLDLNKSQWCCNRTKQKFEYITHKLQIVCVIYKTMSRTNFWLTSSFTPDESLLAWLNISCITEEKTLEVIANPEFNPASLTQCNLHPFSAQHLQWQWKSQPFPYPPFLPALPSAHLLPWAAGPAGDQERGHLLFHANTDQVWRCHFWSAAPVLGWGYAGQHSGQQ